MTYFSQLAPNPLKFSLALPIGVLPVLSNFLILILLFLAGFSCGTG